MRTFIISKLSITLLLSTLSITACKGTADLDANSPPIQSVNLTWLDPTKNTDLTCINQLDGYILRYGSSSGSYENIVNIQKTGGGVTCMPTTQVDVNCSSIPVQQCSYTTEKLRANTWYFSLQVYDETGNLSSLSNEAIKIIN